MCRDFVYYFANIGNKGHFFRIFDATIHNKMNLSKNFNDGIKKAIIYCYCLLFILIYYFQ